jgi:molybdate transport system substrate-binding protein
VQPAFARRPCVAVTPLKPGGGACWDAGRLLHSATMKRFVAALLLIMSASALSLRAQTNQDAPVELIVSAAISLKDALEGIKAAYARQQPNIALTFNFGGSGALQQQIENGAPVDVFLSAGAKQMEALDRKGLLREGTKRDLLTNHLVLIVPRASEDVKGFADLTKDSVKHIAVGEPKSVPVGQYTQETLIAFDLLEKLKPKLVYASDVRQVLTFVETGDADAGFVYYTDAHFSKKAKIIIAAPDSLHSPIVYPVAVLKSTHHPEQAKAFLEFLSSPDARNIFEKYKFPVLGN